MKRVPRYWFLILMVMALWQENASSKVYHFMLHRTSREWASDTGIMISQRKSHTVIYDKNHFEWTLPAPFRVKSAVEIKPCFLVLLCIIELAGSSYTHAFMAVIEKQGNNWHVVSPILDRHSLMAGEEWIESISLSNEEPRQLLVQYARFGEWSGGKRSVTRSWHYWDFESMSLGEEYSGEIGPFIAVD